MTKSAVICESLHIINLCIILRKLSINSVLVIILKKRQHPGKLQGCQYRDRKNGASEVKNKQTDGVDTFENEYRKDPENETVEMPPWVTEKNKSGSMQLRTRDIQFGQPDKLAIANFASFLIARAEGPEATPGATPAAPGAKPAAASRRVVHGSPPAGAHFRGEAKESH